jgi:hypothetical protein
LNPNWSMQQYKLTSKAYKDITTGSLGNQIGQYNNVLQHGAEAQDAISEAHRNDAKFMNTAVNELEKQFGGAEAAKLQAALMPVKDEFALLMSAGYKPSEDETKAYDQIFSPSSTPGQIGAALKVVGAVGAIRLMNINQQYKRVSGQNIPGILTQESMDAAKHLNLDADTQRRLGTLNVGGTLFHNPEWKPATTDQIQTQQQQRRAEQQAKDAAIKAAGPAGATAHAVSADGKTTIYFVNGQWVTAQGQKVQ